MDVLVRAQAISKTYGGVRALDAVDFELAPERSTPSSAKTARENPPLSRSSPEPSAPTQDLSKSPGNPSSTTRPHVPKNSASRRSINILRSSPS
jgi:hypothetical protein